MNDIPIMWATELQEAYPERSGINGWGSVRLLLALRTALQNDTWERIIDGCKRYKTYCQKTGIEGSVYVQAPYRFISEQSYLETFEHKAPKTKDDLALDEIRERDAQRLEVAKRRGRSFGLDPLPFESVGAFETRIEQARIRPENRRHQSDSPEMGRDGLGTNSNKGLALKVSDLTARMRIAK